MGVGNIIIIILFTYYSIYFIDLFNKNKRKGIQFGNKELDKLRSVPVKSLEEQKRFLDMKYPKRRRGKFTWRMVPPILFKIAIFIMLFQGWAYVFRFIGYEFPLWQGILIVMIIPIFINLVLAKFNVQKSDMLAFFKKY